MANNNNTGKGESSSPSSGPGRGTSVRPTAGTRTTSELQRVRFSQDVDRSGTAASSGSHGGAPDIIVHDDEGRQGNSQSATPVSSSSAPPLSTTRTRDRGYSLRRALFTRTITQRSDNASDDNGTQVEQPNSSRGPDGEARMLEEGNGGGNHHTRVTTINENESRKSEAGSSSESRKENVKKGVLASSQPGYHNTWARKQSRISAIQQKLASYQTTVADFIFRRQAIPPSKDGRHIDLDASRREDLIDERKGIPYINNSIRSSRYTLWDFIPRQLFFQFSKLANAYFLIVGILQLIPGLSTIGSWTTIAPLAVFVALSMGKEGYDDFRRYKLDQVENKKVVSSIKKQCM